MRKVAGCILSVFTVMVICSSQSFGATLQTVRTINSGVYSPGMNNYSIHNNHIYNTGGMGRNYNITSGSISNRAHQQTPPPPPPMQNTRIITTPTINNTKVYGYEPGVKTIYAAPVTTTVAIPSYPPYPQQYYYNNVYPQTQVYTTTSTYYPTSTTYINNGNGVSGTITTQRLFTSGWGTNLNRFLSW